MQSLGFVLPLLPGMTEVDRSAMTSCWHGERKAAYEDARRRAGITREAVWIQATPNGDVVVVYTEADDLDGAVEQLADLAQDAGVSAALAPAARAGHRAPAGPPGDRHTDRPTRVRNPRRGLLGAKAASTSGPAAGSSASSSKAAPTLTSPSPANPIPSEPSRNRAGITSINVSTPTASHACGRTRRCSSASARAGPSSSTRPAR